MRGALPTVNGKLAATSASRCLALWIERGGTSKSELELCVFYGSACRDLAAIDAHRQRNRTPGLHSRYVCGRGLPCLHGSPKLGSQFMQLASHRTNGIAAQHRQPCRSVKTAGQAGPPTTAEILGEELARALLVAVRRRLYRLTCFIEREAFQGRTC